MELASFYNHNEKGMQQFLVATQRQGNDKNGNPIYLINIFNGNNLSHRYNAKTGYKLDKYNNIRLTSYNVDATIQDIINNL